MANAIDDIAHLDQLVAHLRRRQRVLEEQYAIYGIAAVPSHLVVEKEDIERQLANVQSRLDRARSLPVDARSPYLGLLTFQEQDADRFFGRDALIDDLVERTRRSTFLAVLGASGSGKSSVVRAGLMPLLRAGALP